MPDTNAIRLLVSDIDGTLVRSDKTLSDGVIAAVKRVQEAGIPVSLISARPPSGILWIAEKLGLDCPIAAFNGGTIVSPDGAIVSSDRLTREAATQALAMIEAAGVSPWLFADGKWYARDRDNGHLDRERRSANEEPVFDADFEAILDSVDKLVGVCDDHDLLAKVEAEVKEALGRAANVARSQPYYLDVTAPRANKGDGLEALAQIYDVPLSAVAVMGDQYNDLPMFARAGTSIAMGQGPEDVRAAATHVARSNDEDGVADAIARFVLPGVTA